MIVDKILESDDVEDCGVVLDEAEVVADVDELVDAFIVILVVELIIGIVGFTGIGTEGICGTVAFAAGVLGVVALLDGVCYAGDVGGAELFVAGLRGVVSFYIVKGVVAFSAGVYEATGVSGVVLFSAGLSSDDGVSGVVAFSAGVSEVVAFPAGVSGVVAFSAGVYSAAGAS